MKQKLNSSLRASVSRQADKTKYAEIPRGRNYIEANLSSQPLFLLHADSSEAKAGLLN